MTTDDVLEEFRAAGAMREGHFILSSGLHSGMFLQKNLVFMHPDRCERLCKALAALIRQSGRDIDVVISRPWAGSFPATKPRDTWACHPSISSGKAACSSSAAPSRSSPARGWWWWRTWSPPACRLRETVEAVEAAGGKVLCAGCIVDRSGGKADCGAPLVALASLVVPAYAANDLPPELAALPAEEPGSRRLSRVRGGAVLISSPDGGGGPCRSMVEGA